MEKRLNLQARFIWLKSLSGKHKMDTSLFLVKTRRKVS